MSEYCDEISRRSCKFEDTSTDCAICLEPLQTEPVITLSCGHKWHLQCIIEQLQTALPTSKQRLLFTGCQCAKCGTICDHENLRDLTRTTDALREKVDRLLREQLALDAPDVWNKAQVDPQSIRSTLAYARRKYAFYLCSHCREPYFGGTVECADLLRSDQNEDERLCVACSPQSQVICRNPLEHRGHLVWKCRYCCRPSTYLCYGNVHFCDECHGRNSQWVRQLKLTTDSGSRGGKPAPLPPIPCPGSTCPYPKPPSSAIHCNGPKIQSEQVYGCAWCQSTDRSAIIDEPGSRNFLFNSSGQLGLRGWRQLNHLMSWKVERSELPVNATTTTNFVSSFRPCIMEQTVDLSAVLQTLQPNLSFEVSARYMARTDCGSIFCLKATLWDQQLRPISIQTTPVLEAPPDYWERARLVLSTTAASRYLSVVVMGKDSRFWNGLYGSKVTEISVRLLGSPNEIERLIRSQNQPRNVMMEQQVGSRARQRYMVDNQSTFIATLRKGILPIVGLLILTSLLQYWN